MRNRFIPTLSLLAAFFLTSGCDRNAQWKKEYEGLMSQSIALEQRHCRLIASTDSLWDITSSQLAKAMPADFPAIDREIFLNARNADHIRMFMSFKALGPEAQSLVQDAGKQDEALAQQIRALLEQKQAFELKKLQFLQKVEHADAGTYRLYAGQLRQVSREACR